MNLLIDTYIALWAFEDSERLTTQARDMLLRKSNRIFVSVASVWEVALKHAAHPEQLLCDARYFTELCEQSRYTLLPIEAKHIAHIDELQCAHGAQRHKDPFDHMLLAQAKAEGMRLVTHDAAFERYGESCVRIV